jgi:hypothetical protein
LHRAGIGLLLLVVQSLTNAAKGRCLALGWLLVFPGHACVQAVPSSQVSGGAEVLPALAVGDYVAVGRQPDSGPPYVEAARIGRDGTELLLSGGLARARWSRAAAWTLPP